MLLEDIYKENWRRYILIVISIILLEIIRVVLIKNNKILDNIIYVFILIMHLRTYIVSVEGLKGCKLPLRDVLKRVLKIIIIILIILAILAVYVIVDMKFNLSKVLKVIVLTLFSVTIYPSFYYIMYWDNNIKEGLKRGYLLGVRNFGNFLIFLGVRAGLKYLLYMSYEYKPNIYFIFMIIELIYFTYMNLNIMNLISVKMEG